MLVVMSGTNESRALFQALFVGAARCIKAHTTPPFDSCPDCWGEGICQVFAAARQCFLRCEEFDDSKLMSWHRHKHESCNLCTKFFETDLRELDLSLCIDGMRLEDILPHTMNRLAHRLRNALHAPAPLPHNFLPIPEEIPAILFSYMELPRSRKSEQNNRIRLQLDALR